MCKKEVCQLFYLTRLKLVLCFIFVVLSIGTTNAQGIEFVNFDSKIKLKQSSAEPKSVYKFANSENLVELSNRIIIKIKAGMGGGVKKALKQKIEVGQLVTFGPFAEHEFVVVSLKDASAKRLTAALEIASGLEGVIYAQPDILQIKSKLEVENNNAAQWLTKTLSKPGSMKSLPFRLFQLEKWQKQLQQSTQGEGVKIVVIDDGFDLKHEALSKTKILLTYDIERRVKDVQPQSSFDIHGTKVLGVIFARANDALPVEMAGLAIDAELIAIRQTKSWTSHTLESLHIAQLAQADIVNMSWQTQLLLEPIKDAIDGLAQTGRGGKGTLVVLAAGNSGKMIKANSTEASIASAVVVGAMNSSGMSASFSDFGKSVSAWMPGYSARGIARNNAYSGFGGTSYAAAYGTGIIALLLATEPELSVSKVKQKLAQVSGLVLDNQSKPSN
ncbi:S8 family serine peptidase [Pseudoalteromonas sp. OANN1]|uniref:S8 family peptidase n=1 Tax=Pseudoalteromonas sp. OANN1 TaxID=2954497 RepID=UPI002096C56E|nr:S8 family serine peptidase [Pseudoalteromonas sp. OANN1]MCO7200861.1 S8 family serine peptidase [Pseudoalteromonas sp. OANN1]